MRRVKYVEIRRGAEARAIASSQDSGVGAWSGREKKIVFRV